jgi:nicotinate-nucleotide pyrophosphorylase (carboxylating)
MDLEKEIDQLIQKAIAEDVCSGDITSLACLTDTRQITGAFVLKESATIAGLPLLPRLFKTLDPHLEVNLMVEEGSYQKAGTIIAKVYGSIRSILAGERIALNLLQHASGVATVTAEYVKKLTGLKCDILDTRKTLPGLRALEKYAVAVGGGKNHRNGLDDCYLIKSSHLAFMNASDKHPIAEAFERIKMHDVKLPVEIQIDTPLHMEEVLKHDFRAIMLRNMSLEEVSQCLNACRQANKRVYIAFSGNVSLDTIRTLGESGINGISVAALTHSVPGIDMGMRLK